MVEYSEVVMVNAANYALNYRDKNPHADIEEIIKKVVVNLSSMEIRNNLKVFGLAAASEIFKIKGQHPDKTNKQVLQIFVNNLSEFLDRIEGD